MAASILANPGTKYGPCDAECEHTDCIQTRKMAQVICTYCGKEIGYGTCFYHELDGLRHALCFEEALKGH